MRSPNTPPAITSRQKIPLPESGSIGQLSKVSLPKLPDLHDLVRLYEPTFEQTVEQVELHLTRPVPAVSYRFARSNCRTAFSHAVSFEALRHGCQRMRLENERKINLEVIEELWHLGRDRHVQCYSIDDHRLKLPPGMIRLRKDVLIGVRADFIYLENRTPKYFWAQARRGFALNKQQLGLMGSALRHTLLRDDDIFGPGYNPTDLEIFDLSVPSGLRVRVPRVHSSHTLPLVAKSDIEAVLQRVVDAFDHVMKKPIDWAAIRSRRPRQPPAGQDGLDLGQ